MGRNIKQGFNYFSLDVDIFSDIKIRKLIKNHSGRALSVYICVLAFIYKNGYYVVNDEDFGFIVSEQTGDKVEFIEAVLDYCVKVGLFSEEMFNKGVYTSIGVQKRYLSMCKASKRTVAFSEYNLISSEEMGINSEEMGINSEKMTQSKEKKSKIYNSFLEEKKAEFDSEEKKAESNFLKKIQPIEWYFLETGEVDLKKVGLRIDPICQEEEVFFLKCWEYLRLKVLKKVTGTTKLTYNQRSNYQNILKMHTRDEVKQALQAFFGQDLSDLTGANAMQGTPEHFLRYDNFTKYLQAFYNNEQVYSSNTNTKNIPKAKRIAGDL